MGKIIVIEDRDGRSGVGEVSRDDPAAEAFALETAQLDLKGQQRNLPAWMLLGGEDPANRPVGQVCFIADEIKAALEDGVKTIKIKDVDLGVPKKERDYLLRIDLNGRPELTAALALHPELIEEPAGLHLLKRPVNAPLAADESLAQGGGLERALVLVDKKIISAFVLKPVLLGGIRRCLDIARAAKQRGAELIVTHYFDGPVAHAAATQLAFALPKGRFAHGLGWHKQLLREDVPHLQHGELIAPTWPGVVSPEVRAAALKAAK